MTTHPDPATLREYLRGRLATAATREIDAHARDCAVCRAALTAQADVRAQRRLLLRLERERGHLDYESLAAFVDDRLAAVQRPVVERHLAICPRCRREWTEMRAFAPALARPLKTVAREEASEGFLAGIRRWFAQPSGLPLVAAGVLAVVAASFVISNGGPTPGAGGGAGDVTSAHIRGSDGRVEEQAPNGQPAFDRGVFDRLDRIAPEARADYARGDFAKVATALRLRAQRGEAGAQHALGLLYAEGRGVPADRAQAINWLERAAAANDTGAALDLARLRAR
jgi:anti-sigma factor RsiW